MKRSLILFVLLWNLLLLPVAALADSGEPAPAAATSVAPATPDAAEPDLHFPGVSGLTAFHTYFSHNVENLSRRIDSFFATTRAYEESSGTYLLVRGSVIYGRGGEIDYDGKLRAHLDLPNLSDRLNLLIESEQPDQPDEDALTTGNSTFPQSINNQALAASLQYILQAKEFWDVRLQPGIKLKWTPDPFVRLRFRWLNPLSVTWLSRVTFTPAWYSSRGWGARVRYDLERGTGGEGLFRSSTEVVWDLSDPHNLFWTEVLFFAHPFGRRAQVAYDLGVNGEIEPKFEDTRYFSSIRYRRDIHHGWVFLELKPQIEFLRDDDFKPSPSIALTLEMLFGGRYL
jgi:hypothetical protein